MCSAIAAPAAACISVFASAVDAQEQETARPRAVSASLCADAYLLALGGADEIAGLSWQSRHALSAAPDWARALPQAWPSAERLLDLSPELTVFGPGEGGRAATLIDRAGLSSLELVWGEDFNTVRTNLARLGEAWRARAEADAAIADLDARLETLSMRSAERGWTPRVAYLSASGGSAGSGTYIDAAIRAAGGANAAAEEGLSGWGRADPESALRLDADLVVTSFFTDGYASVFNRGARHAAYDHVLEQAMRVDVPASDWPCAGPRLIEAAEAIADALDALPDPGAEGAPS